MDPRAVPSCSSDTEVRLAVCPLSLISVSVFTIYYSKLLDATILRFALFMNSILVVIGEINKSCLSSLVKGTYLTMRLRWKSWGQALNCDFENTLLEV